MTLTRESIMTDVLTNLFKCSVNVLRDTSSVLMTSALRGLELL